MNREDIIRMAREADLGFLLNENWLMHEELERFAALVASAEAYAQAGHDIIERPWTGLTDEERNDCLVSADPCETLAEPEARQLMEDIEAKLKEKNT